MSGGPVQQPVSKAGNVQITKVGHTFSNVFGSEPMAKTKNTTMPTEQTFGK